MAVYFTDKELACPCCGVSKMSKEFVNKLDKVREKIGQPMMVNSGYRCAKHNQQIGGVNNSPHVAGVAVDIKIKDNHYAREILDSAVELGFIGIELCDKHIHLDDMQRKSGKVVWASVSK